MKTGKCAQAEKPVPQPQQNALARAFRCEAGLLIDSLGGNVDEAARRMGLSPETLKAWLAETDLQENRSR